VELQFAIN